MTDSDSVAPSLRPHLAREAERDAKIKRWIKDLRDQAEWRRSTGRATRSWTDEEIAGEVARYLVEDDVATGEYEGCSSEMELAYCEYVPRVERILREEKRT